MSQASRPRSIRLTTDRSRWWALAVLCAGMLMVVLDQTIEAFRGLLSIAA